MSDYVRFPEAYRRLYWRILDAIGVGRYGYEGVTEAEAEAITAKVLDLFENLKDLDKGPDMGPELCGVCEKEIGGLPSWVHEECQRIAGEEGT